jgi:hypothetical protein
MIGHHVAQSVGAMWHLENSQGGLGKNKFKLKKWVSLGPVGAESSSQIGQWPNPTTDPTKFGIQYDGGPHILMNPIHI